MLHRNELSYLVIFEAIYDFRKENVTVSLLVFLTKTAYRSTSASLIKADDHL